MIFPDFDRERLRPLFKGEQNADTLTAALKITAERFAFDPANGAAVLVGWRRELEDSGARPVPRGPPRRQDVVQEMRALLDKTPGPLDFPLLGARPALRPPRPSSSPPGCLRHGLLLACPRSVHCGRHYRSC